MRKSTIFLTTLLLGTYSLMSTCPVRARTHTYTRCSCKAAVLAPQSPFAPQPAMVSITKGVHNAKCQGENVVKAWESTLQQHRRGGWTGKRFRIFLEVNTVSMGQVLQSIHSRSPHRFLNQIPSPEFILSHQLALKSGYTQVLLDRSRALKKTLMETQKLAINKKKLSPFLLPIAHFLQREKKNCPHIELILATEPPQVWLYMELAAAQARKARRCWARGDLANVIKCRQQHIRTLTLAIKMSDRHLAKRLDELYCQAPHTPTVGFVGGLHSLTSHMSLNGSYRETLLPNTIFTPLQVVIRHPGQMTAEMARFLFYRQDMCSTLEALLLARQVKPTVARSLAIAIALRMDEDSIRSIANMVRRDPLLTGNALPAAIRALQEKNKKVFIRKEEQPFFENPRQACEARLTIPIPYKIDLSA